MSEKNNVKKIDVILKYFYPVSAGIEINSLQIYSNLVQRGWDITIHTSKSTLVENNILSKEEFYRGLKIVRYSNLQFYLFPAVNPFLNNLICLHNFNVLPHFSILLISLMMKILRIKKHKLYVIPHGGFTPEWSIFSTPQRILKILYHRSLGKFLLNCSVDNIRAVSQWEKEEMVKMGIQKKKIVVIENGLEDEAYEDPDKNASKDIKKVVKNLGNYIIQIGRIFPIKNYETTIKALSKMQTKVNYAIVGPVGDHKYLSDLKRLAKNLKVEKQIFYLGVKNGVDKYFLMKKARLMVHMAKWESFCNVINEGMSQGLVTVVANNTALRYIVKNNINGYLVNTYDSDQLSKVLDFVINGSSTKELEKIKKNNIEKAKRLSWKEVSINVENSLFI